MTNETKKEFFDEEVDSIERLPGSTSTLELSVRLGALHLLNESARQELLTRAGDDKVLTEAIVDSGEQWTERLGRAV